MPSKCLVCQPTVSLTFTRLSVWGLLQGSNTRKCSTHLDVQEKTLIASVRICIPFITGENVNTQLLNDKSKQYEVSSNFDLYLPSLPWLFWIIYMFVGATGIYHSKMMEEENICVSRKCTNLKSFCQRAASADYCNVCWFSMLYCVILRARTQWLWKMNCWGFVLFYFLTNTFLLDQLNVKY